MVWRPWRSIIQPDPSIEVVAQENHPLYPTLGFTFRTMDLDLGAVQRVRAIGTRGNYQATGNPGAATAPRLVRGEYGQAVNFDGIDDHLRIQTSSATDVAWTTFMGVSRKSMLAGITVLGAASASVNTYGLKGICLDTGGYTGLTRGDRNAAGDGLWVYNWDGGDDFVGPMPFTVGVPVSVGMTHDGTTMRGYIDRREFGSAASGPTADTSGIFRLGINHSVDEIEATFHWIYFYNRVLTPYEMLWGMAEPWAFYLQRQRRAYFIPTAAAPTAKPATHYFRQMSA